MTDEITTSVESIQQHELEVINTNAQDHTDKWKKYSPPDANLVVCEMSGK